MCIGVLLILTGVTDVKGAWAPYMYPVVVFIMCCLVYAIALEKAGLTQRLGQAIARKAGDEGKLFGSVGTADIAEALTAAGNEVDKSEVRLPEGVFRATGDYEVAIHLHADVDASITVSVVAEE